MDEKTNIIEYKCPCCNAGLSFGSQVQKLTCAYCDNTFDLDTVQAYNDSETEQAGDDFSWEAQEARKWSETEQNALNAFQCPACGGEILTDDTTAATFCPSRKVRKMPKLLFCSCARESLCFRKTSHPGSGWRKLPVCMYPSGSMTATRISAAAIKPPGSTAGPIPDTTIPGRSIFC